MHRVRKATSKRCLLRCMSLDLALTARSLHCSGYVRLQHYIPCFDEAVGTPAHDPIRKKLGANTGWRCRAQHHKPERVCYVVQFEPGFAERPQWKRFWKR